ncbi:MAG: helix-turn-helix domain-containing protein [Rikenellaceae bacterium]
MSITKEYFDKRVDEIVKLLTNLSLRVVRLERDKNMINLDRYLTYKEASSVLGISERSISRLIEKGELVSIKFERNRTMHIRRDDVYAYRQREIDKVKKEDKK